MKCPHSILSPNESLINGMDLNKRQNVGAVLSSTRSNGSEIGLVLDDFNDGFLDGVKKEMRTVG